MSVIDELASLTPRSRKTRAVRDVVESAFKQKKKVFAGHAFLAERFFKIIPELLFKHKINTFYFLLLAQLLAVACQHFAARRSMLSRRIRSSFFDRARRFETTVALQK
jgi:hypothetical protein